ncbi:hypothetical protein JCM10207_007302 [Rhodosporidiobolus poonsookiae]
MPAGHSTKLKRTAGRAAPTPSTALAPPTLESNTTAAPKASANGSKRSYTTVRATPAPRGHKADQHYRDVELPEGNGGIVCHPGAEHNPQTQQAQVKRAASSSATRARVDRPARQQADDGSSGSVGRRRCRTRATPSSRRGCTSCSTAAARPTRSGLVRFEKPLNAIHSELTARLLWTFLPGHPSHPLVFLRLFQTFRSSIRSSSSATSSSFFERSLHGLFDEHRFFDMSPANELALTASLFGDLIQFHLIGFVPLGMAVRYVRDALRNPSDSDWFRFGIQALALPQLHPDVANTARQALMQRDGDAPGRVPGGDLVDGLGSDVQQPQQLPQQPERVASTAIHVEDAGGDPEAPDEATSDKILFIVNNLAPSNFDSKVKDMMDRIEPMHLPGSRTTSSRSAASYETFVKVATLLNSDKTVQSSTERTLLKNLGSWLGGLTLAKDKPIKQSNIAFKQLLIEGYDSNRLIVAIPFVCKVLEQSSKSRVLKPLNPWLMAILGLLVELYQFAELKLNLKFEIEVLCKSLHVDPEDVEPTELFRNRSKELAAQAAAAAQQAAQSAQAAALAAAQVQQNQALALSQVELALASLAVQQQAGHLSHDIDEHGLRAGQPLGTAHHALPAAPSATDGANRLPPMLGVDQLGYSLSLQDTVSAALQNLPNHVVFKSQVLIFATNASLKRLICVAIDRAIREIIAQVVERLVTIVDIPTRELTMKDFAMEGDEGKMAAAAYSMVQITRSRRPSYAGAGRRRAAAATALSASSHTASTSFARSLITPSSKSEVRRTFFQQCSCPYGRRCCFIHVIGEAAGDG